MDHNTPEYRTMIQCTPQLEIAIKNQLTALSGELLAVGLLSADNVSALRNQNINEADRAAKLVEFVADKVCLNTSDYLLFVEVLRKRRADNKSILPLLEQTYKSLGGKEETGNAMEQSSGMSSQAAAHPGMIAHTMSEPAMSTATQPTEHSDVHRSMSTPGHLCFSDSMSDKDFKQWLCTKGLRKDEDCRVLFDDGINAKCLALLDEKAIAEVATKLSIGGRAIFPDICKEAMKNGTPTTSVNAVPCMPNGSSVVSVSGRHLNPRLDQHLEMKDHFEITQCLTDLPNEILIYLGGALGLRHTKVEKMRNLPGDMVAAWLRKEDDVLKHGKPTWRILANALKSPGIGQNGIADKILNSQA